MTWFIILAVAYFLNAVAITADRFLLTRQMPNPTVFAFFISALSLLAIVLVPFGFKWYSWDQIAIDLIAGALFTFALFFMFKSIANIEASRSTPFIGGLQPVIISILAWLFLGEILTGKILIAFVLIIIGSVIISWQKNDHRASVKSKNSKRVGYETAIAASILFAVAYTLNKYAFGQQDFISAFVMSRVGAFLGALMLLIPAANRIEAIREIKGAKKQTGWLFVGGQIAGALSFILVNYAISIATSVAVVNALQGLQYIFLLTIMIILGRKFPKLLDEKLTPKILTQKLIATAFIIFGLFFLFI
ncbi:MAG: GRP family sugar transporter [bacterium]